MTMFTAWFLLSFSITTLQLRHVYAMPLESDDAAQEVTHLTAEDFQRAQQLTTDDLIPSQNRQQMWVQKGKAGADYSGKAANAQKSGQSRNGVKLDQDKWAGGQIPYVISNRYNQRERAVLARAMQAYHDKTCIRFVPRSNERDYIYIAKIDGCFSDVGRAGGRQEVSLDDGCLEYDTAIHELMHAVGFWHEHERWDRNDFIDIIWQNIERDAYDQFGKVNLFESDYYGETYDYFSIMHYDSKSFSKNGLNTIEAKASGMTPIIGRVKDFSAVDLRKINKLYRCNNLQQSPTPVQPDPTPTSQWFGPATQSPSFPEVPNPDTSRKCIDSATLCWRWVDRCRSPFFEPVMREFCAQTCGFCSATDQSQTVDWFRNGR